MIGFGVALLVVGALTLVVLVVQERQRRHRLAAFFAGEAFTPAGLRLAAESERFTIEPIVALVGGGAVALGLLVAAVTGSEMLGVGAGVGTAGAALFTRHRRADKQRAELRSQMADGLSSIASSMTAGSSFLQGVQQLARDARPPLGPQLELVLNEIEVGVAPSEAFAGMGRRTDLEMVGWLSHLLRLQETNGSPLVSTLQRLAAVVRQGDELQREVRALTAEGRMSAWVLAALPVGLCVLLEMMQPGYLDRFTNGWWLVISVAMVVSVVGGLLIINRMIKALEV